MTVITRRSPAHEAVERRKPRWGRLHDMPVALEFGGARAEMAQARKLALCDVSALPRLTVKGPGAERWLREQGLEIPPGIYEIRAAKGTDLILRTGSAEFLVEQSIAGDAALKLISTGAEGTPGVYLLPRQDASFLLIGRDGPEVLLETCGVDLSAREPRAVFSRVAGVSCALLPLDIRGLPSFQIWTDGSYGAYLWETLLEIVEDWGGSPVGISSVFPGAGQG